MITDKTNMEYEMYDLPVIIRATETVTKGLNKLGSRAGKTFNRFTTKKKLYLENHT